MTAAKLLLSLAEAAALTPYSETTLRRAVRATDPAAFPPPLKGKRDSKGKVTVLPRDLQAWVDSLPDA